MFINVHSDILNTLHTEMFSCVQEPPLISSPPDLDWCGRLLGHIREETTICIKGLPRDFVVDQPEHTDNKGARCQTDVKSAPAAHHLRELSLAALHSPVDANTPCASQSSDVHTETAKCQRAVTNLFERGHFVSSFHNCSITYALPLDDRILDEWRSNMTLAASPILAEEMIKYLRAETQKLIDRNAEAALISCKICTCKLVEPETKKYIKCTVFAGVTETNNIPRQSPPGCGVL